ncbi:hypothetical protein PIB30_076626 [Stylosanthes scabra]|uniref:Uncharacterized protein n=1 Tax=Stylosanthes scabra TaxID=79078 RepID=A0ABU6WTS0_9FABA|nr:hypothetical protein [Stylosanthes scabra]
MRENDHSLPNEASSVQNPLNSADDKVLNHGASTSDSPATSDDLQANVAPNISPPTMAELEKVQEDSAVYASPQFANRPMLSNHLQSLALKFNLPWLLLGDFNEVLRPEEVKRKLTKEERKQEKSALEHKVRAWDPKSRRL